MGKERLMTKWTFQDYLHGLDPPTDEYEARAEQWLDDREEPWSEIVDEDDLWEKEEEAFQAELAHKVMQRFLASGSDPRFVLNYLARHPNVSPGKALDLLDKGVEPDEVWYILHSRYRRYVHA